MDFSIKHSSGIELPGLKITVFGYSVILYFCHRKPERTFKIKGYYFPVCARCTGLLTGFFISLLLRSFILSTGPVLGFLIIPLIVDGFSQELGFRESNNLLRFLTGIIFSIGMSSSIWWLFG